MNKTTRSFQKILQHLLACLTLFCLFNSSVNAQTSVPQGPYPNRPIKFIVPITPGGSNDVVARIIANKLTDLWSQPVVVDNRPGAGMNLGADLVAKSPPDGYTWLLGANNIFVTNPHVGKVPFVISRTLAGCGELNL